MHVLANLKILFSCYASRTRIQAICRDFRKFVFHGSELFVLLFVVVLMKVSAEFCSKI